jgi:membrane-bound ClpP family serine protease
MSEYVVWGIGLVTAAFMLFILELLIPSGGIIGLAALVVALAGVAAFFFESPTMGFGALLGLIILAPLAFNFAIKIMPNTPIGRRLILGSEDAEEAEAKRQQDQTSRREREQALVGVEGKAANDLRPVGTAIIEGTRVEVLSEEGVIEAGARVRVTRVEGNQVRVRRA